MVQQCFFIAEKQQKTILIFSLNSLQQNNINMEHHKILNLLNEANDSKFVTRKWNTANDNSKADYSVRNEIIYNTKVLKSNFCYYNNAYILVGGDIAIIGDNGHGVVFRNCGAFTNFITNIEETKIDDAEDFHLVVPMYNLTEYNSNYSETTGSLWFYSKV